MTAEKIYISVHVPKTAGSSFKKNVEAGVFGRMLYDYDDRPISTQLNLVARRYINRLGVFINQKKIVKKYDIIHGHFAASKYRFLGDRAHFMCFLRDPVERTISHYYFWKNTLQRNPSEVPLQPILQKIVYSKLSLADFAREARMCHFYKIFVGGLPMDQFEFVGITEEYERSIALAEKIFGVSLTVNAENVHENTKNYDEIASARDFLKTCNVENYVYYHAGVRRFHALCAQYGV